MAMLSSVDYMSVWLPECLLVFSPKKFRGAVGLRGGGVELRPLATPLKNGCRNFHDIFFRIGCTWYNQQRGTYWTCSGSSSGYTFFSIIFFFLIQSFLFSNFTYLWWWWWCCVCVCVCVCVWGGGGGGGGGGGMWLITTLQKHTCEWISKRGWSWSRNIYLLKGVQPRMTFAGEFHVSQTRHAQVYALRLLLVCVILPVDFIQFLHAYFICDGIID